MNLKDDFLEHINDVNRINSNEILCTQIEYDNHIIGSEDDGVKEFFLTTGWTKDEWDNFLSDIDIELNEYYDDQVSGYIWYSDGTWSSCEDGLWIHNTCPEIPEKLNRLDKVRQKKINNLIP